jgi:hypothetical protein
MDTATAKNRSQNSDVLRNCGKLRCFKSSREKTEGDKNCCQGVQKINFAGLLPENQQHALKCLTGGWKPKTDGKLVTATKSN